MKCSTARWLDTDSGLIAVHIDVVVHATFLHLRGLHQHDQDLVLCMEPIAACLALENRLSWAMSDKYLVSGGLRADRRGALERIRVACQERSASDVSRSDGARLKLLALVGARMG